MSKPLRGVQVHCPESRLYTDGNHMFLECPHMKAQMIIRRKPREEKPSVPTALAIADKALASIDFCLETRAGKDIAPDARESLKEQLLQDISSMVGERELDFFRYREAMKKLGIEEDALGVFTNKYYQEKPTLPVGVSVLMQDEQGKVLLAKRRGGTAAGIYSTPGGRVELNETLLQTAVREAKEETGVILDEESLKVLGYKEHFRYGLHYIMFYVLATRWTGKIVNMEPEKSDDWVFFHPKYVVNPTCTEPIDILDKCWQEYLLRVEVHPQ